MKKIQLKNILIISLLFSLSVIFSFHSQTWTGTGNNFGSGWLSDGFGGFLARNNFGSGWQSDGSGGLFGTGNNFVQVGSQMVLWVFWHRK